MSAVIVAPVGSKTSTVAATSRPLPNKPVAGMRRGTWLMLLGFVLALAYPFLPANGVYARALITVVEFGALTMLGIRLRSRRLTNLRSWTLITIALSFWVPGDAIMSFYYLVLHRAAPFPGPSDPLFLLAYAFAAWGLFRLTYERTGLRLEVAIDSALICLGLGVPMYILWIDPIVLSQPGAPLAKLVLLLYPFGDFLFCSLVVRMMIARRKANRSAAILASAIFVLFLSDVLQAIAFSTGNLDWLRYVQVGWLCAAILIAASAWHPSGELAPATSLPRPRRPRTPILVFACLLVPISVIIGMALKADYEFVFIGFVSSGIMMSLMLVRTSRAGLALEEMSRDREELLSRALRDTENERSRLAGELHDGPIQRLAAAGFHLENATRRLEEGDPERVLWLQRKASEIVAGEIDGLRQLMTDLRPPALDEAGIDGALRDLAGALMESTTIECVFEDAGSLPVMNPELETVIYRVTQEALRNVVRHSRASSVRITLRGTGKGVEVCVRDDGVGFEAARAKEAFDDGRFGLAVMAHRAEMAGGSLEVDSAPGGGTNVRAFFGEEGKGLPRG
jgi:signal transduction histidine kinase